MTHRGRIRETPFAAVVGPLYGASHDPLTSPSMLVLAGCSRPCSQRDHHASTTPSPPPRHAPLSPDGAGPVRRGIAMPAPLRHRGRVTHKGSPPPGVTPRQSGERPSF